MSAPRLSSEDIPPIYVSSSGFDDMGAILDRLDVPYTPVAEVDLAERSAGIVMLNCSFSWRNEVDESALRSFVRSGGALMASDLTYHTVSWVSDASFEGHSWGNAVEAEVVDPELVEALGQDRLELDFDTALKKVDSMPPDGEPLLRSVDGGHVIAYKSSAGDGHVLYTSFHNHSQSSEVEDALLRVLTMVPIAESTGTTVRETYTTVVYGGDTSDDDTTIVDDVRSEDGQTETNVFEGADSLTVTLSLIDGGDGDITRELAAGETAEIGRSDFHGLADDDARKYVSGTHLELRNDADVPHATVRDADSTNGTKLDGRDISDGERHPVDPEAEVELADEVRTQVRYD